MKCTSRDTHLFRPISFQSIHTHTQIPISSLNFQLFQQQIFPSIHPSTLKLAQLFPAVFFCSRPFHKHVKYRSFSPPLRKLTPLWCTQSRETQEFAPVLVDQGYFQLSGGGNLRLLFNLSIFSNYSAPWRSKRRNGCERVITAALFTSCFAR